MFNLRRRSALARSLDQTIKVETDPIQVRDLNHHLIFKVSGSIHATYRVINTKQFVQHYPDIASFEPHLKEHLAKTANSEMGNALSGKDRSEFAKAGLEIGQTVKQQLSAFFDEYGIKLFLCACTPVVLDSANLDAIETKIETAKALEKIRPGYSIIELLPQANGMNPAVNAWIGQMLNPPPPNFPAKDNSLI